MLRIATSVLLSAACLYARAAAQPLAASTSAAAAAPAKAAPEPSDAAVVHVVKDGETLWDIARAYGVHVDEILQANGKSRDDAHRLSKGMKLQIPGATRAVDVQQHKD